MTDLIPRTQFPLVDIPSQSTSIVTSYWEKKRVWLRAILQLLKTGRETFGSYFDGLRVIQQIKTKYEAIFGEQLLSKIAKVDGKYYWRLGTPGFPSRASYRMHINETRRFGVTDKSLGLRTLFIAVTKRCPLRCEHCFESEQLNQPDTLRTEDIIALVHKYQDYGTTQIMFSGGEPMLRIQDIYRVLEQARPATDFWVITSGLGLNQERALRLKAKGLTGVMVSLDHYLPEEHNRFRGFAEAWNNAISAVLHAKAAGLVTTLSLCATKAFISRPNLTAYMELAKKLGVAFVQFIEPAAVGGYRGQDVSLQTEHYELLEEVYLQYNSAPAFHDYPIINYLGYFQRRVGCFGGGDRFFYVDTDGYAHLCPFCSGKISNALEFPPEDTIHLLSQFSCHDFSEATGL